MFRSKIIETKLADIKIRPFEQKTQRSEGIIGHMIRMDRFVQSAFTAQSIDGEPHAGTP